MTGSPFPPPTPNKLIERAATFFCAPSRAERDPARLASTRLDSPRNTLVSSPASGAPRQSRSTYGSTTGGRENQLTTGIPRSRSRKLRLTTRGGIRSAGHATPLYPQKLALNFADKWRSLGRDLLKTNGHGVCLFVCLIPIASLQIVEGSELVDTAHRNFPVSCP
jgi:hypothetical protein